MPTLLVKQLCAGLLLASALCNAQAQTVIPLKGQTPEQIQADAAACQAQATPSSTSGQPAAQGGRLKGAATGAVAGAAVAQVRGNQHEEVYDRLDADRQQDYRQNKAQNAAAAGVVIGGARQRQERRASANSAPTVDAQAYGNCMSSRGYSISP
ncbi:MAG: hypothetical protein WA173_08430 [Pseudomonas sp.]|uniref:hypothetical protein n=1 Tax=Pseudomonas sp. TaxID=306 RepID=UPI003BB70C24